MITKADYVFMRSCLPVLNEISLNDRILWGQQMTVVEYSRGVKLQCGKDDSVGLILLKSGSLRIHLLSREGREITLYHVQAGEACVLSTTLSADTVNFSFHIETDTHCEALLMGPWAFAEFCKEFSCIEIYFGRLLTQRISSSVQTLARALSMNMKQRLAVFLYEDIVRLEENDIKLTHDQIARHIGSTREVVTRILNYFSDQGVVRLTRGNVEVLNREKLAALIR